MATVYCLDCMATIDNTDQLTFLNKTQDQHGIHLLTSCLCTNILSPMGVSRSEKDIAHGVKYLLANFNLPYDNKVLIPYYVIAPSACVCLSKSCKNVYNIVCPELMENDTFVFPLCVR